jgi:2,4-dienoyl-CoA reductase-like NADH-dependent reductase (Old Yellow Enzyme family)
MENEVKIFEKLSIRSCTLKNRIVMSPMCQYSSDETGEIMDWHRNHWISRAIGGVGLILSESIAVSPEGRLTNNDLMLTNKNHAAGLKKSIKAVKEYGAKFGVQLSHCGRKSWSRTNGREDRYDLFSASPIRFDEAWKAPREMSSIEIREIIQKFKYAAKLAVDSGVDVIEIHAGHGYLLNQFLSPLSNKRVDQYGGGLEGRAKILVELCDEMRGAIGKEIPLFVRISCTDWAGEDGFKLNDAVALAKLLKKTGVDLIDCSSGGTLPKTNPKIFQGYQVDFSHKIKSEVEIMTSAVGMLSEPSFCEDALRGGRCDLIMLGRELLSNPYWPLKAAKYFEKNSLIPSQYIRGFL